MKEKIKNKKIISYLRRVVQVIFFFFLPALFIQIFLSIKAIMMLIFHHQGTINAVIPNIILLFVATLVTVVAGRFFCGWMCAFGSMGDFLYWIPRMKNKNPRKYLSDTDKFFKCIKYFLLAIIVIFIWGFQLINFPTGINPWDLFGMLSSDLSSINQLAKGWIPAAVLLLVIMIASAFVERFFCRYLCPLGAYFSMISRLRIFNIIKKRENCKTCTICTQKCSMGMDLKTMDKVHSGECINCMECIKHCPRSNAHMEMNGEDANAIVAGIVTCTLVAGSYYLGNFYTSETTKSENTNSIIEMSNVKAGIAANIADGTYIGSGNGFRGQTSVSVKVESGIIKSIVIDSTNDDSEYINKASSVIISEIIDNQSTDVDAVSGATFSSNGIISAVKAALSSNSSQSTSSINSTVAESTSTSDESSTSNASSSNSYNLEDGTYEGSGSGFRGETKVTVKVSNGKISDITIDSYQDDQNFFDRASTTVIQEIIDNQSVDVDAVSGATYSSNGIKEAVANALNLSFTPSSIQNEGHGRF